MTDTALTDAARAPQPPVTEGLPDLVRWYEGMLLAPQHLQQGDVYWQEQLRYRLSQVVDHAWGLARLELDTTVLGDGIVRVKALECMLPDGTPVVYPGSYVGELSIDLTKDLVRGAKPVRVSLVLPALSAAATRRDDSLRRYERVQDTYAIDENTGVGSVNVDRLRPLVSLRRGGDIPAQCVACPLLEMSRNAGSGSIELGTYHPPMLRWQASDFLGRASLRRRLLVAADALWAKLRELAGHRSDDGPDADATARGPGEAARRLAAVLPRFTLVASRPDAKPVQVYDALADVVGAMAGFGLNPVPPVLDAYRHDACEAQFRRALDYVVRKLSYIQSAFEYLEFERDGHRFSRLLPDDIGADVVIELRLPEGRPAAQSDRLALQRWLRDACIACDDLLDEALKARVSARPRLLDADEAARLQLRGSGVMFIVEQETIEISGGGHRSLVQPGSALVIDGYPGSEGLRPEAILLHRPRRRASPHHGRA